MAGSSRYTVRTLIQQVVSLEHRELAARDLPDSGGELCDTGESPEFFVPAGVYVDRRKLREWPDVERFACKCEATGFEFNVAGVNRWLATVCDTHGKRPSEVADWSLTQFCDLASSPSGANLVDARVGEVTEVKGMSDDEAKRRLLSLFTGGVTDEKFQKAAAILQDESLNVNDKLTKIDTIIPFPATASAEDLGRLLGVTKQTVLKTEWWKQHRKGEKADEVGRRHQGHLERAKQYESSPSNDED